MPISRIAAAQRWNSVLTNCTNSPCQNQPW